MTTPYEHESDPAKRHSAALTDGPERAPARAMLKGIGFDDADLARPLVGVATTWIETMPCNLNQRELAQHVKRGVRAAGGTPMEFNTISVSDGVSMGTEGMRASLVSREVIADSIELVARGHLFDGLVCLVGCDKTIPAAVMAVAVFRVLGRRGSILEANISQTIGSASTSLASGTIFTIPALFLWGMAPPYLQVVTLCFLGGVLGLSAMIPLRRILIVEARDELPYPEGTACAEVLKATSGAARAGTWIFRGIVVAAAVKLATGLLFLFPSELSAKLPILPNGVLSLELAPALLAVGYILGYRQSGVLVAGSLVSALVPDADEQEAWVALGFGRRSTDFANA